MNWQDIDRTLIAIILPSGGESARDCLFKLEQWISDQPKGEDGLLEFFQKRVDHFQKHVVFRLPVDLDYEVQARLSHAAAQIAMSRGRKSITLSNYSWRHLCSLAENKLGTKFGPILDHDSNEVNFSPTFLNWLGHEGLALLASDILRVRSRGYGLQNLQVHSARDLRAAELMGSRAARDLSAAIRVLDHAVPGKPGPPSLVISDPLVAKASEGRHSVQRVSLLQELGQVVLRLGLMYVDIDQEKSHGYFVQYEEVWQQIFASEVHTAVGTRQDRSVYAKMAPFLESLTLSAPERERVILFKSVLESSSWDLVATHAIPVLQFWPSQQSLKEEHLSSILATIIKNKGFTRSSWTGILESILVRFGSDATPSIQSALRTLSDNEALDGLLVVWFEMLFDEMRAGAKRLNLSFETLTTVLCNALTLLLDNLRANPKSWRNSKSVRFAVQNKDYLLYNLPCKAEVQEIVRLSGA